MQKRHIAKTISYRVISTVIGFLLMWLISGSIKVGAAFGVAELVYKPIQYYLHERIWYKINFGLKNRGYIANANQQYILSPGRKLKVWIPFKQEFVEVKIIEILNEETFKDDRFIKLSILSADNTKLVKTLKPGDTVELPIGANNTWVTTKISDSLYIYDKRLEYPISLNITII